MNKKYRWDKKHIIRYFLELKKRIYNENLCYVEKLTLQYYLDSAWEMIVKDDLNPFSKYPYLFSTKSRFEQLIKDEINDYSTPFQRKIITSNYDRIKENKKNSNKKEVELFNLLKRPLPIEKQITLAKDLFSKNLELQKAHEKLFNPNNHLLNITKIINQNCFFHLQNDGYIINKNNGTVEDFTSLCHEMGHYDEFINTNGILDLKIHVGDNTKLNNYLEVYSLFYELISIIYLKDLHYINKDEMFMLLDNITELYSKDIEFFLIALTFYNTGNNFIGDLRCLDYEISNISMYYYSYIIAINLFNQYLQDPEKSFYNLDYLINNINPNSEKKVLKYCDIDPYSTEDPKKYIK